MDSRKVREHTHYVITIFILTGGFLISSCPLLRAYLLFLVILVLHWVTNDNQCFISEFDYKKEDIGYTQGILKKAGIHISKIGIDILNYSYVLFMIWFTYRKLQRTCAFHLYSVF